MASGLQRDWNLSVHAVELESGPVYFCSEKVPTSREVLRLHKEKIVDTFSREFPASVKFTFTAYNPGDETQSDVKNAVEYKRLEEELATRKPAGSRVMRSYSFFPDDSSHFERGVCLVVSDELESIGNARKLVHSMCLEYGQAGYLQYGIRDEQAYQDLVSVGSGKVEDSSLLVRVEPPLCHPVFAHPNSHSIFQNITKLQKVLSEMKDLNVDGVEELLAIASQHSIPLESGKSLSPPKPANPLIVVEGMDAAGKSTLTESLSASLNATRLFSPPNCLKSLRAKFDAHPQLIRRAFYVLGNYIVAQEIADASKSGPVIMDRFWHSSAAYAIATEAGCGDASTIPPVGHDIYKWPEDLLKPDVAILLIVDPKERRRRLLGRGEELTDEEKKLDKSELFQERLLESYKRMRDPCLHIIDASGSREDVLEKVKRHIKEKLPKVHI